jgi:hypothetical protein
MASCAAMADPGKLRGLVASLVEEALAEVGREEVPTSAILDKAIRIARLRNDAENLIWLTMEARAPSDEGAKERALDELRPFFDTYEELKTLWHRRTKDFIAERNLGDLQGEENSIVGMSVREIEVRIEGLAEMADDERPQPGMSRVEADSVATNRAALLLRRSQFREVLARIRSRLLDYLSQTEREIVVDAMVTSIFEEQRQYVDSRLRSLAPEAFQQLAAAYERRREGTPEALSQALTSCRRALKSVADAVYPAQDEPVVGSDGVERPMTESRYISRLLQFAYEKSKGRIAGKLLAAQLEALAGKLEALNDLASKGVHANVTELEANQAIIQTYLALGEILSLADDGWAGGFLEQQRLFEIIEPMKP